MGTTLNDTKYPDVIFPTEEEYFETFSSLKDLNDGSDSLTKHDRVTKIDITLHGFDLETNKEIECDWTQNRYGHSHVEIKNIKEKHMFETGVYTTESICAQAAKDLDKALDEILLDTVPDINENEEQYIKRINDSLDPEE